MIRRYQSIAIVALLVLSGCGLEPAATPSSRVLNVAVTQAELDALAKTAADKAVASAAVAATAKSAYDAAAAVARTAADAVASATAENLAAAKTAADKAVASAAVAATAKSAYDAAAAAAKTAADAVASATAENLAAAQSASDAAAQTAADAKVAYDAAAAAAKTAADAVASATAENLAAAQSASDAAAQTAADAKVAYDAAAAIAATDAQNAIVTQQSADAGVASGAPSSGTLLPQTLTISSVASSYLLSATAPTLTTTAQGSGNKTFSSSTPTVCSVDSSTGVVEFDAVGSCTITASIAPDAVYATATSAVTFAITADAGVASGAPSSGTLLPQTLTISSVASSYLLSATAPTLTTTAQGSGNKTFSSSTPTVCSVDSSTGVVEFDAVGSCTITASIAPDAVYATATSAVTFAITPDLLSQSLTLIGLGASYMLARTPPTLSVDKLGTGTVTFESSAPTICTVDSSSVLVLVAVGTCTLTARITADAKYAAAVSPVVSIKITSLLTQTLKLAALTKTTYSVSETPPTITATGLGTGRISYLSASESVCTIDSTGEASLVGEGSCTLSARIAADDQYESATSQTLVLTINAALLSQSLMISGAKASYSIGETGPTLIATATGTGRKTFSSSTTSVCTVGSTSGVVVFVAGGICSVAVEIEADSRYAATKSSTVSFTIVPLTTQTLTISSNGTTFGFNPGTKPQITLSAPGSGARTYSTTTASVCLVSSTGVVTPKTGGTCTISGAIAADAIYRAATSSDVTMTITSIDQTIWTTTTNTTYRSTDTPPTLTITSAYDSVTGYPKPSGTRTLTSSTTDVCTVAESTGVVAFLAGGTCTITAMVASDSTYRQATKSVSFLISESLPQTLTISSPNSTYAITDTPPSLSATALGTATISYVSSTTLYCKVSNAGVVTFVKAGTCTISVSIPADIQYVSATKSFTFAITLVPQTLTITEPSTSYLTTDSPTLVATSSASLATGTKRWASNTTTKCSVVSTTGKVTFIAAGECKIEANVAADVIYASATSAVVSFTSTLVSQTLTISPLGASYMMNASTPTLTSTSSRTAATGAKTYTSSTTAVCTVASTTGKVTFVAIGTCSVSASIAADTKYDTATSASVSFAITLASQVLSLGATQTEYARFGTTPTMTATSSFSDAAGAITFSSSTTSVCVVDSTRGVVGFGNRGTCTITASMAADAKYAAVQSSAVSFKVKDEIILTIYSSKIGIIGTTSRYSFGSTMPDLYFRTQIGTQDEEETFLGYRTGAATWSSQTPSICTVIGGNDGSSKGVVSAVGVGRCTISVSQAADDNYLAATAESFSFEIAGEEQSLVIDGASFNVAYEFTAIAPILTSISSATSAAGVKSYSSASTTVCSVASTGQVQFISVGTCTITATISADTKYYAAKSPSISFEITKTSQTLTINSTSYLATYKMLATPPTITSVSSPLGSTGAKSYLSADTAVCTVASTGLASFVSAGECTITASIAADTKYNSATSDSISFTTTLVDRKQYVYLYYSNSLNTYPSRAFIIETSYNETDAYRPHSKPDYGARTWTSSTPTVCTVKPHGSWTYQGHGYITALSAGDCKITVELLATFQYATATSAETTFIIPKKTRTISLSGYVATYQVSGTPPTITATASGTGTKTFSSSTTNVCTIAASSGVVTFVGSGNCTIGAEIAADNTFQMATATSISFTISPVAQTISIDALEGSYLMSGVAPTVTATALGTGAKTFIAADPNICTIGETSGVVVFVATGTCTVRVKIAADQKYLEAESLAVGFVLTLATQKIRIAEVDTTYVLDATAPTLTSTAQGTGVKTYTSSLTNVCTVDPSSGAVAFVGVGVCVITAEIGSDAIYERAATKISFEITGLTQTLSIASVDSSYTLARISVNLSSISLGTGRVTYTTTTPDVCTFETDTKAIFVSAGTCTISAKIAADTKYLAAESPSVSFATTLAGQKLRITSSYDASYTMTSSPPTIVASSLAAGATGAITYSSSPKSVCMIGATSGLVAFVSAGSCKIIAMIDADSVYLPAQSPSISFSLTAVAQTLVIDPSSFASTYPMLATAPKITATATGTGGVSYLSSSVSVCTVDSSSGLVAFVGLGTCKISAAISRDNIYSAATSDPISFAIVAVAQTLTIDPLESTYLIVLPPPVLSSTALGGGARSFTATPSNVCAIDGSGGLIFAAVGICEIGAEIDADNIFEAATAESVIFRIVAARVMQRLEISAPPQNTVGGRSQARAQGEGDGAVTFFSQDESVCTIDEETDEIVFVAEGSCVIAGQIAGDATYLAATSEPIVIDVNAKPVPAIAVPAITVPAITVPQVVLEPQASVQPLVAAPFTVESPAIVTDEPEVIISTQVTEISCDKICLDAILLKAGVVDGDVYMQVLSTGNKVNETAWVKIDPHAVTKFALGDDATEIKVQIRPTDLSDPVNLAMKIARQSAIETPETSESSTSGDQPRSSSNWPTPLGMFFALILLAVFVNSPAYAWLILTVRSIKVRLKDLYRKSKME